jgi:6-phosphogluconolactonase
MRSKSRWLPVSCVLAAAVLLNSCSASRSTASMPTSAMWIATQDDQMVRSYRINHSDGSISPIGTNGSPVATGLQPTAIAVARNGPNVFIANAGDSSISQYVIGSDGSLTSAFAPVRTGSTPMGMAVDPSGAFVFVADYGANAIMVFGDSTGALTLVGSFATQTPLPAGGTGPVALAVAPNSFPCTDNRTNVPATRTCYALYAANQLAGTVTAYDYFVDSNGGFVRGSIDLNGNFILGGSVPGSPYSVGAGPSGLAFSRCAGISGGTPGTTCATADNNNLFVANSGSNSISVFSACIELATCRLGESSADGSLVQIGSPVAAGNGPTTILVDPSANFVYVLDLGSNQISEYHYSPVSGALTLLGSTMPNGTQISAASLTPSISLTSATSNWILITTDGALSALSIGSDGSLTPVNSAQVTIQGQPSALVVH